MGDLNEYFKQVIDKLVRINDTCNENYGLNSNWFEKSNKSNPYGCFSFLIYYIDCGSYYYRIILERTQEENILRLKISITDIYPSHNRSFKKVNYDLYENGFQKLRSENQEKIIFGIEKLIVENS